MVVEMVEKVWWSGFILVKKKKKKMVVMWLFVVAQTEKKMEGRIVEELVEMVTD